ncbi:MAG: 1-(5-phosphoribosyl)-5-[(5-phosphoribosylamino)methylideneamino] imidazole-4-carboxamide isomerase [Proteobacteria bacterium]|nr:MAG: 1-(5-phosphoribosyl)-5-[(5-phosphoribosylamino)methylideneamino] imidazole-4-carboxamide isomerase [Pseudomonadota bacterium]
MSMKASGLKILPAIDLMANRVVRLKRGNFHDVVHYEDDPLALARAFEKMGAEYLHVVDLDGARAGRPMQRQIIEQIAAESSLKVQVGGGLKTLEDMKGYLDSGIERIVLGSLAVSKPRETKEFIKRLGADRITLALDLKTDLAGVLRPTMNAWSSFATFTVEELFVSYEAYPEIEYLCTDISRDGCMEGIDPGFYKKILQFAPRANIIVSGGITTLADVQLTQDLGLHGLVLGKALHDRRLTIAEVLAC